MSSNTQRVILISGANQGIGFEAVKLLSSKFPNDKILLGTRSIKNGEASIVKAKTELNLSLSNVESIQLDVTDESSIKQAAQLVDQKYGGLDILINNAGIAVMDPSRESSQKTFDVNVFGVQRMNDAFLPLLIKKSTATGKKPINIIVASEVGAWVNEMLTDKKLLAALTTNEWNAQTLKELTEDYIVATEPNGDKSKARYEWPETQKTFCAYGASKAIVLAYATRYARQHPELDVAIVCPGYCATELNHFHGPRPAKKGGESITWPVDHQFTSGGFYQDGETHPMIGKKEGVAY